MHGFSSGSTFLVNAEVDSMGGVVDGGAGIGNKPSPHRAAIEKAQAELRLEYDVREERRRELEFLEKGGNPLDFKFGHATSVSVQSTSHTYQQPDQIFTSEAKGSFALTASPHGDSVESSGRLGVTTVCEPNSADNFDGETEILESERKHKNPNRSSMVPSEHSPQLDGSQNGKELEDSPIFYPKKGQAYRRRNRSRPNRDAARSSSNDVASRGGPTSLPGRHAMLSKNVASENKFDIESDGSHALQNASVEADDIAATTTAVDPNLVEGKENVVTVDAEGIPSVSIEQKEDSSSAPKLDSGKVNGDMKSTPSHSVDGNGNTESDLVTNLKNVDDNGVLLGEKSISADNEVVIDKLGTNPVESTACFEEEQNLISQQENVLNDKDQEIDKERFSTRDEVECPTNVEKLEVKDQIETKIDQESEVCDVLGPKAETSCLVRPPSSDPSSEVNKSVLGARPPILKIITTSESQQKQIDKADEDRVLEEARIIEAKRRRIADLSVGLMPSENRRKSQWDFVLEEMAWLANDFAQERVWKMTAASQICHRAAFACRLRMEEQSKCRKQKSAARTLAEDVMEFWHSAWLIGGKDTCSHSSQRENCKLDASSGVCETGHGRGEPGDPDKDEGSEEKQPSLGEKQKFSVFEYAVRFLQENCCSPSSVKFDGSGTSDVVCDVDVTEVLWQNQLTEENLFYVVPPGAMETYRKSIESCLADFERENTGIQEEVDTSVYEPTAEIVYQENDYDEDVENAYYQPGLGSHGNGRPIKQKQKSLKIFANRYGPRSDFGYGGVDSRNGTQPSALLGKRPANNLQVGLIPTKRTRTAPRQRVIGPFTPGPTPSRTDASSGDTNSFQDDQSTLHGPLFARGSEVDSPMDYDKQLKIDSSDNPGKSKKKKKFKNSGASYSGWPVDPTLQNDQKDHVRKRHDHPIDTIGNNGFNVHHTKKPKTKHLENTFENIIPASGSVSSPVASQMSNMSSQNKIIKILGGRERRKAKGIKVPAVQPGSGNPWSSFEDQALIVLVHDMGPNWELVSDAINSTLRFKCIFRKPQECKDRHKNLMDRNLSDGADSAEDSGSSQPYPSTLPGIPKGSARQLFQQLQRPMEEDTIKSHFDKMIHIAKQFHYRKKQNDNQDLKQVPPVHGSHVAALKQVFPNNLNGVVLTPLDLCDLSMSNQDAISLGFQGPHGGGLPLLNQGASPSMHPPGGLNSSIQGLPGSPSMGIGNNLASQSSQFTNSRDAKYPVPRSTSLPIEEQQRLQQYGHMLPGRNIQASNLSSGSVSGTDRGVRMHPSGNSVGMVGGMSRGMPIPRPGLQGITSSSMLNSASMVSSNMGGVPSNMNIETTSGQGNSMFKAHEALHMARPGKSSDHQRQMMSPEASTSGTPPFSALSSGFTNQTASPPLQPYATSHPILQQHSHMLSGTPEQQQAYLRLARERQIQQRLLHRQHLQQQRSSPSSLQSGSPQLQSPSSSQPVSLPPVTPSQGLGRIPQSGRQHPQQRQQSQPLKLVKGMGRKDMLMHQNGVTTNPGNQVPEKGEQKVHLMQSHGLNPGPGLNSMQASQSIPSSQTSSHLQQQKPYANLVQATSKKVQKISTYVDGNNPGPPTTLSSSSLSHKPPLKVVNQSPLAHAHQRAIQPNRQLNSDPLTKLQPDTVPTEQFANNTNLNAGIQPPLQNVSSLQPMLPQKQSKYQLQQLEDSPQ